VDGDVADGAAVGTVVGEAAGEDADGAVDGEAEADGAAEDEADGDVNLAKRQIFPDSTKVSGTNSRHRLIPRIQQKWNDSPNHNNNYNYTNKYIFLYLNKYCTYLRKYVQLMGLH
jgi:hypothetical protein